MRVVLVVANYAWFGKRPWRGMTTSVPIITSILKDKFELHVIDANINGYSEEEVRTKLQESEPEVVLITALSTEYFRTYHAIAKISKEVFPEVPVIMGGVYPTVCPEHVVEDRNIDIVMMGHAEERLDVLLSLVEQKNYELIKEFEGIAYRKENGDKIIIPLQQYIGDVSRMVKPDYSLVDVDGYLDAERKNVSNQNLEPKARTASIISSYGCPYNCLF